MTVTLPASIRSLIPGFSNKVVLIQSSGPIQVNTLDTGSCGSYLALPLDVYDQEYVVSTWHPADGESNYFAVISTQPDTTLTITQFGVTQEVVITQQFQAFVEISTNDLTGTHIMADKPVAVVAGNPGAAGVTDNSVSYLWPTSRWGSQFVVPAIPGSSAPYYLKLTSNSNTNTLVQIHGTGRFVLRAREFLVVEVDNRAIFVQAEAAIQVLQYTQEEMSEGSYSHPSSIVIPATVRYASDFFFVTPFQTGSFLHFITVIIAPSQIAGLLLDTIPVPLTGWQPVLGSDGYVTQSFIVSPNFFISSLKILSCMFFFIVNNLCVAALKGRTRRSLSAPQRRDRVFWDHGSRNSGTQLEFGAWSGSGWRDVII